MNLQEALKTAEWLLQYAYKDEMTPEEILRVRKLRDTIYYLNLAAGIAEIRLDAYDQGQSDAEQAEHEDGGQ